MASDSGSANADTAINVAEDNEEQPTEAEEAEEAKAKTTRTAHHSPSVSFEFIDHFSLRQPSSTMFSRRYHPYLRC